MDYIKQKINDKLNMNNEIYKIYDNDIIKAVHILTHDKLDGE